MTTTRKPKAKPETRPIPIAADLAEKLSLIAEVEGIAPEDLIERIARDEVQKRFQALNKTSHATVAAGIIARECPAWESATIIFKDGKGKLIGYGRLERLPDGKAELHVGADANGVKLLRGD
jgi:hypothetical protein